MKLIDLDEIRGEEILARAIVNEEYQELLSEGVVLKKEHVAKLKEMGIREVFIKDDGVNAEDTTILKVDITNLCNKYNNGRPIKVVANLPYYITTPIIMGLFESGCPLESITIMVQKEVADRMKCGPGSKDYGALSLAVQFYSNPEIVANVSPESFIPKPGVGSAVIRLTRYPKPPVEVDDEKYMFKLIRAAFNMRRKTMVNSLMSGNLGLTKEEILSAIDKLNLSPQVRGEALTLNEFAALSNILSKANK